MNTLSETPSTPSRIPSRIPGLAVLGRLTAQLAPVTGRILLGGMFTYAGATKITSYAGTAGYMESVGLPGGLLPLVIAFEIIAGLMLIIGWKARATAVLLAGFTGLTALMFHANLSDPVQSLFFVKNMAIAGGLLVIAGLGAGPFSVDRVRK